ncbi:restriction endonuclease subunit S [Endozoicomonas sp. 2B-B]
MDGNSLQRKKYAAYPEYKDSGVEWLSSIPKHWNLKKVRYVLKDGSEGIKIGPFGSALKLDDMAEHGHNVYGQENVIKKDFSLGKRKITTEKFQEMSLYQVFPNDILITMMGTSGKCEIVPEGIPLGIIDSHLLRTRVKEHEIDPRFFKILIDETHEIGFQIKTLGKGSIMHGLNSGIVKDLVLPLPDRVEQDNILSFLSHETAKIDTLIEEQQSLIRLMKEKRQAVISHAVTKGLNPDAPMKDSGMEWLGEVPEHWEVKRVRHACEVDNNLRTPIDRQTRMKMEGEYPYYGPTGILNYINQYNVEGEYFLLGEDGDHFLKFKEKSMTIHVKGKFNVNNHAHLIKGKGTCSTAWACLYFEHMDILPWLIKQGVGRYKLQKTVLADIPIFVPPEDEQDSIMREVAGKKASFDMIAKDAESMIAKLQERRTALISAAVTGKIDVRDWVAPS